MKILILEIQKGGLGDHLFYSHLPRIAKETGRFDKVYISTHSIFRHPDYQKLVWETNPYLDGFVEQKGIFHFPEEVSDSDNLLDRIMLLYGLDDGIRFHEPEIYYSPTLKPELQDKKIYDPNFISYTGDLSNGKPIEKWLLQNNEIINLQMTKMGKRHLGIENTNTLEPLSLFDFCSVIVSAKKIYCLSTGTGTLAAALKVPVTVFYGTGLLKKYRHSKMHTYICLGSNLTWYNKLKKWLILFFKRFILIGTR